MRRWFGHVKCSHCSMSVLSDRIVVEVVGRTSCGPIKAWIEAVKKDMILVN